MSKTIQHSLILGFALFALYFGAGNLIFPPSIGISSGTGWIPALTGFVITDIALLLLAVIAILNAGGRFEELTRPISPWFYKVFHLLLMVGIGVFVTIPRMSATTHELGIQPLFPGVPSAVTIIAFFAVTFYFALDQSNVIDRIGKILTPLLIVILLIIVGKGIFSPMGIPVDTEVSAAFSTAFISAYQTGDIVTGIFCAPIFLAAILSYGYKGKSARKMAITGTLIAGAGLLIVYGGLLYIGATSSSIFPQGLSDTALVSALVDRLLGGTGAIALSIAIALACLTSAIGVVAVIADFLRGLFNDKIDYRAWLTIICLTGIGVGMLGVERIVNYTMPIFQALYPVAIVLVVLGVFRKFVPSPGSYRGAILLTFIVSLSETLVSLGFNLGFISALPLSANGFAWLVPAIIGFIAGTILYWAMYKNTSREMTSAIQSDVDKLS